MISPEPLMILERPIAALTETLADTYRWYTAAGRVRLNGLTRWWLRPTAHAA